MPYKSKATAKPSEPKPKYSIGQKAFFIDRIRSKTGEVLQVAIQSVHSIKVPQVSDTGKITHFLIDFEYDLHSNLGRYEEVCEIDLYPTLTAVSLSFAQKFIHLLK